MTERMSCALCGRVCNGHLYGLELRIPACEVCGQLYSIGVAIGSMSGFDQDVKKILTDQAFKNMIKRGLIEAASVEVRA